MQTHPLRALLNGGELPSAIWLPETIADILERACSRSSGGIVYGRADGSSRKSGPDELREEAERILGGLRERGLRPGHRLILQLAEPESFLPTLWGCLLGGIIPVLLPPATHQEDNVAARRLRDVRQRLDSAQVIDSLDSLPGTSPAREWSPGRGADVALLMLTSGSTGVPKIVRLTHANVAASIAASAFVNQYRPSDISMNWLPLFHIGALMRSLRELYLGAQQIQVPTHVVSEEPLKWIDLIDQYRATLAWGPNAAFAAVVGCQQQVPARQGWNLNCVRSLYSSGEAVVPRMMRSFAEMFSSHGLRPDALHTAWGMTEACFATFSNSSDGDVGLPVPGVSIRIVNDDDQLLQDGQPGHLQISGPLVSSGYEEDDRHGFTDDGWLRTGDLGAIRNGRLTITGRDKEVTKIGGAAFSHREIESVVEELHEIGWAVACGVEAAPGQSEALAIFIESSDTEVVHAVRAQVARGCGIAPRFVISATPAQIPRTSVGKIQRAGLRQALIAGSFEHWRSWPYDLQAVPPASASGVVTDAERYLAGRIAWIIGSVLRMHVGVDDDFFAFGGTSLQVARAVLELNANLPEQSFSVIDLFRAPTPLLLSLRLTRQEGTSNATATASLNAQQRASTRGSRRLRARRREPNS